MALTSILDGAGRWVRRAGIVATGGGGVLIGHPVVACIASIGILVAPGLKIVAAWGWSMFCQPAELALWIEGWANVPVAIRKVRDELRKK